MEIGARVGAILDANDDRVRLFGYGVYEGDHVPIGAGGWMGKGLIAAGIPNPRIRLDNGDVVYGCECWWGPEEKVKEIIGERPIVNVLVSDAREAAEREEE